MLLEFTNSLTHLKSLVETNNLWLVKHNEGLNRTFLYLDSQIVTVTQKLSSLLLPFVNNNLDNFIYICDEKSHWLVNYYELKEFESDGNKTTLKFGYSEKWVDILGTYPYHELNRIKNELAKGTTFRNSSQRNI